ncbi:hypothetical protein K435DRAFT_856003 [Dendrothele bispora CBS 962.96]|uniref:Uncharacterized protein n=1 Tax=Dendrothele bispora (strain CBS 962.96) TaxID=1314807 RepID=A0A4S8MAS3_DENBC|nr:hypothetical protein K435DRAFT_856003 [Dendrothele bispora CBS 962.96]
MSHMSPAPEVPPSVSDATSQTELVMQMMEMQECMNEKFMAMLANKSKASEPDVPKPPEFPTFVSNSVQPSKSLLDVFPSIPQPILLDIACHDFEPTDLRKIHAYLRDNLDEASGSVPSSSSSLTNVGTFWFR